MSVERLSPIKSVIDKIMFSQVCAEQGEGLMPNITDVLNWLLEAQSQQSENENELYEALEHGLRVAESLSNKGDSIALSQFRKRAKQTLEKHKPNK